MANLDPVLKSAQDDIIESNDPERAYEFAHKYKKLDIDVPGLENIIVKSGNPIYIYRFANDLNGIKNINILALENAIINTNSLGHICLFANNVNKGKNISRLQDKILTSKNPEFIFLFARDVENADVHKLVNAAILTKNFHFINKFTKIDRVDDTDKKRLKEIYDRFCGIVYKAIESKNPENLCIFAIKYQNLGLDQEGILGDIEEEVIKSGDPKCIYDFAKFVRKSNKHKLVKAILASDDFEYMYKFFDGVSGIADYDKKDLIDKLKEYDDPIVNHLFDVENVENVVDSSVIKNEELAIRSWDPEKIYEFAMGYDGDKHDLEHAIINIGSPKFIYMFALNVKDANIDALANALINSADLTYSYKFAKNIHGLDDIIMRKFTDKIIESSDVKLIYQYSCNVDELAIADKKKLSEAVAKLGSTASVCKFARDVKDAYVPILEQSVISSENASYINWFAENIGGDIQKLESAIIECGNSHELYEFAKNVKNGVGISELENKVIEFGDPNIMCMFAVFKDSNVKKLGEAIKNTGDAYCIDRFIDISRRKRAIPNEWYDKYFRY